MKKRVLFLSVLLTLVVAGCSNLVTDLGKMKGGVKYTVKHLLQNVDAVSEDDYTLEEPVQILYGLPGEYTKAEMKSIKGFSLAKDYEIIQQIISEDETTVVEIKYDRNEYTIQFDPNGGLWNYDQVKEHPSVEKLSDTVKVTGRFGAVVKENDNYPDFAKLKKKGCIFVGWKKVGTEKVISTEELESKLPETFEVQNEDIVYEAQWEINGTKYIVRHMTEDLDGVNYSLFKEVEMAGDAGDMTEASAIDIDGFIKPVSVEVKEISDDKDNPTVIEIKYTRATYNVTINLNGGYWNYKANKVNSGITLNGTPKVVPVKYGTAFAISDYLSDEMGKKSMKLAGWFKDGDTTVCIASDNATLSAMPAHEVEYKASWVDNYVNYKVEYWLENTNDNNTSIDSSKTKTLTGLAETLSKVSLTEGEDLYVLEDIEGFVKPASVTNVEIKDDGSSVVKVEYKRMRYSITLNPNGGAWNYEASKAAPESVKPDVANKLVDVKFGGTIVYPELSTLGMKGNELVGWKLDGTETVSKTLPTVFDKKESIGYTAVWAVKTSKYKVEYHLQNIAGTDFELSEKDTVELSGPAETPSKVSLTAVDGYYVVKDIPGFSKPEKIDNKEINADGSTVIVVNYTRNTYEIKFELDDGLWNYSAYNADKTGVTPDSKSKLVNVKYGDTITYPSFSDVGKRSYELINWITDTGATVTTASLPVTQTGTKNITYTASWKKLSNIAYKVEHLFENVDSDNDSLEVNYTIDGRYTDNNKTGVADMLTEAAAKPVTGFTAKEIEQLEINRDGSTIVKIYYKRNVVNVNLDLNGGYWDYNSETRTGSDSEIKTISGKFGTTVNYSSINTSSIGRRSYNFSGWTQPKNATPVPTSSLISTFPAEDLTYTASWENIGTVAYKVEHWFEKVNSTGTTTNSTNYEQVLSTYPTETLYGVEGDPTDAHAKTVEGFTASSFTQPSIARNGSTVVKIYYTRNTSKIILKVNGGKWSGGSTADKTYTGKFGKTLTDTIPEPTRSGWAFGGWNEYNGTVDKIYGAEDVTYSAYWIPSVTVTPTFNGDISMTVNTVNGTTTGSVTLPSGYSASDCNFRWYVDGVFASDVAALSKKLDNGIHTVSVKVTIDGVVYTKQATVTISK